MQKQQLCDLIRDHLSMYPEDSQAVVQAVSDGLASFTQAVQQKRNRDASNALLMLLGGESTSLYTMINVVFYLFPTGVQSHAQCEIDYWHKFLALAKKEPIDLDWLKNIKGEEYVTWWHKYVQPKLT
jgi:hypothetical protein